jgi:peroxiredoxin
LLALSCVRTSRGGILIRFVLPIAIFLLTATSEGERKVVPPTIGATVADVAIKDVSGRVRTLREFKNKKAIVVVFVGTECPIANLYFPTLAEMQKRYADKGVQILAINSNDQDTFADVVAHANERKLPFPVCKDADQSAMEAFRARRTPEVFLLDGDRTIRYRGRIDDQYGYTYRRAVPTHTELKDALTEMLAGKRVTIPESECQGCLIGRARKDGSNNRVR